MPYGWLDDKFTEHPKVIAAGGDAAWLWVCGYLWVQRNLTRGLIPKELVPRLSDRKTPMRLADRLVKVGLWEDAGEAFRIHDYEEHNRSALLAEEEAKKRSDKAKKAAAARWSRDAPSNAQAHAQALPEQMHEQCSTDASRAPDRARPNPNPSVVTSISEERGLASTVPADAGGSEEKEPDPPLDACGQRLVRLLSGSEPRRRGTARTILEWADEWVDRTLVTDPAIGRCEAEWGTKGRARHPERYVARSIERAGRELGLVPSRPNPIVAWEDGERP